MISSMRELDVIVATHRIWVGIGDRTKPVFPLCWFITDCAKNSLEGLLTKETGRAGRVD